MYADDTRIAEALQSCALLHTAAVAERLQSCAVFHTAAVAKRLQSCSLREATSYPQIMRKLPGVCSLAQCSNVQQSPDKESGGREAYDACIQQYATDAAKHIFKRWSQIVNAAHAGISVLPLRTGAAHAVTG